MNDTSIANASTAIRLNFDSGSEATRRHRGVPAMCTYVHLLMLPNIDSYRVAIAPFNS